MEINTVLTMIRYGEPVVLIGIFYALIGIKEQLKHVMTKEGHMKFHKEDNDTLIRHDQQLKTLNKEVFKQ